MKYNLRMEFIEYFIHVIRPCDIADNYTIIAFYVFLLHIIPFDFILMQIGLLLLKRSFQLHTLLPKFGKFFFGAFDKSGNLRNLFCQSFAFNLFIDEPFEQEICLHAAYHGDVLIEDLRQEAVCVITSLKPGLEVSRLINEFKSAQLPFAIKATVSARR